MSEFNIEDLDAVISEAKSSLVQMLALQLKKEIKNVADLEGKNSLLQSKLDLISGLMDATSPAIEIVEQGVSELQSQNAELAVQLANAESKRRELAAENVTARNAVQTFCDVVGDNTDVICEQVGQDGVKAILAAMSATGNMPATDAFLAEVRAQGVEMFAIEWGGHDSPYGQDAYNFAAQLRKGAAL